MTMLKMLRDRLPYFSVHDFRSAFKTWAAEAPSFPDAVREPALAHIDATRPTPLTRAPPFVSSARI
jgi:hypothetical protein